MMDVKRNAPKVIPGLTGFTVTPRYPENIVRHDRIGIKLERPCIYPKALDHHLPDKDVGASPGMTCNDDCVSIVDAIPR
jgi:hypothetical protein